MRSRRIIVIGAGVVGTACALALQKQGDRVTVIDRAGVATGCSFGNAGVIAPSGFPLSASYPLTAVPRLLFGRNSPAAVDIRSLPRLLPWGLEFSRATRPTRAAESSRLMHEVCAGALKAWDDLLGADCPGIARRGYWTIYFEPDELRAGEALIERRRRYGVVASMISAAEVAAAEPFLAGRCAGAGCIEEAAHIEDPAAFTLGLAAQFRELGGQITTDAVSSIQEDLGGEVQVFAGGATYRADKVVVATGVAANRLLACFGHRIPLISERGYHLELDLPRGTLRRPILVSRYGAVLVPSKKGVRLVGGSHFGAPGTTPSPELLLKMLSRVAAHLGPLRPAPGATVWSGERPATPDSLPVIEQVPGTRSVVVAAGHCHGGLTLAAVTARLVAGLIAQDHPVASGVLTSRRFRSRTAHQSAVMEADRLQGRDARVLAA